MNSTFQALKSFPDFFFFLSSQGKCKCRLDFAFDEVPCLNHQGHQYGHSIDTWLLKKKKSPIPSKTLFHILFIPADLYKQLFVIDVPGPKKKKKNPTTLYFFPLKYQGHVLDIIVNP